jgi:hypothetical protein
MATPGTVFSQLVTTTFRKHRKEITTQIDQNNAFHGRMTKKGRKEYADGGLTLVEPLEYAQNGNYQRFSGYDVLDMGAADVISAAEFQWRNIAISVAANGTELRINSGDSQIIKLAKAKLTNAVRSFKNNFSSDLYSDGTLPNQINGLQALVADAGTGTVGGINSTTWPFWRNVVQSAAAPLQGGGAITVGPATIENDLFLPAWLTASIGNDKPDLIVCDMNYFTHYEKSQVAYKRYTNGEESAQGGIVSLKYKTADVVYDGDSGIPANHAYMLNTDFLKLIVHPDADMTEAPEMRSINQDASVVWMLWMGNLVCSNRSKQAVIKA